MYENVSRSDVTDELWLETRSEICSMERFTFGIINYRFMTSSEKNTSLYTIYWNNGKGADLKVVVVVVKFMTPSRREIRPTLS